MLSLPRLAVGTIRQRASTQPVCWALLTLLADLGLQVQHFHARACFTRLNGAAVATGLCSRHVDSWLMTPDDCRRAFVRGCRQCDAGVVEGSFDAQTHDDPRGGPLDDLCEWLDLPRVAALDVRGLEACRLPQRPAQLDALLLDGVADAAHFAMLQTTLEPLWGVPVVGGLGALPALREAIDELPRGGSPSSELCRALAASMARFSSPEKLLRIAGRRDFSAPADCCLETDDATRGRRRKLIVAVAYDDCFNCYFPDTLDLLEARGAQVIDFSPLADESLPDGADLVYFGCGHPERFAAELARNHCMTLAIQEHVCAGRKIYAEGGGLAYLCQRVETADGRQSPLIGVFPAIARLSAESLAARPVEATLSKPTWLGPAGRKLRGYLNDNWTLDPLGPVCSPLAEASRRGDMIQRGMTIGSRIHLNFAAQPQALDALLATVA